VSVVPCADGTVHFAVLLEDIWKHFGFDSDIDHLLEGPSNDLCDIHAVGGIIDENALAFLMESKVVQHSNDTMHTAFAFETSLAVSTTKCLASLQEFGIVNEIECETLNFDKEK